MKKLIISNCKMDYIFSHLKSPLSRAMAFLAGLVSFHMGKPTGFSQQHVVGTYEEDRERQEAANENRSCLYGLSIPDCPCTCLAYPQGERLDAPEPWTNAVHVNTFPNNVISVLLCMITLCRWNQTQEASHFLFFPLALWRLICLCRCEEQIAPEWLT